MFNKSDYNILFISISISFFIILSWYYFIVLYRIICVCCNIYWANVNMQENSNIQYNGDRYIEKKRIRAKQGKLHENIL